MSQKREIIRWSWKNPLLDKQAKGETPTWEDFKPIFRPDPSVVHWGRVKIDKEKCSQCGLCVKNCLAGTLEMDENNYPRVKTKWDGMPSEPDHPWPCFACWQCLVPCPTGAISVNNETYFDDGYWKTLPYRVPSKLPLQPRDANGKPTKWNAVEREVFIRRSAREYLSKPVPDYIIQRVLEAGRFAPTGGNGQGVRFIVITSKALIREIGKATEECWNAIWDMYRDGEKAKELAQLMYQSDPVNMPWGWYLMDPRLVRGGIGCAINLEIRQMNFDAPCVIILACDMRNIGNPNMSVGIAGQNMNLVANSLGVKATWVGFPVILNSYRSELLSKLGIDPPFQLISTLSLGYPKFKQEGVVPRQFWPVTWFREGVEGAEVETEPVWPEVEKPGATSAL